MRIMAFHSLYALAVVTLVEAAANSGPVIHDGVLHRRPGPGISDWIEIYNPHSVPLDLTSITLHADGQTLYVFAGVLSPSGFFLATVNPPAAGWSATARIQLLDPAREELDSVSVYLRGDYNGDSRLTITDAVCILRFVFGVGPTPFCQSAADSDGDDRVSIEDAVALLRYLFLSGPMPQRPYPDYGICR